MIPILAGIVSALISNNLPRVAQAVVERGVDYVSDKLGVELKPDMSQEDIQKVAEAAMKHEEFCIEQAYKDTADARDMQKEALKQDDVWSKRFIYIFAGAWSLFAMIFIFCVSFGTIQPDSVRFVDSVLGFLMGTVVSTILQFFFGSSLSSRKKTEDLMEGLKDVNSSRKSNG